MNSNANPKLLPVLRRPRRDWRIPTSDLYAPSVEQQQREASIKALCEGTTPYGREIFRRILDLAARRLQENKSALEAARDVEEEMITFHELHAEFVLLLGRITEVDPEELRQCSPFGLAFQIVLRALGSCRSLNEEDAAEGQPDQL